MNPRVLLVKDLQAAYEQGQQVLQRIGNLSPYFLLNGYTAMVYRNNSDALNNLWISVEQLTEFLWVKRFKVVKESLPNRVRKCHAELRKPLESNQIKAKHTLLRLAKILSRKCHKVLSEARVRRNDLAHRGIVPELKLIESLWAVMPELLETASYMQTLGLRALNGGEVENWDAPKCTNFEEWIALANEINETHTVRNPVAEHPR